MHDGSNYSTFLHSKSLSKRYVLVDWLLLWLRSLHSLRRRIDFLSRSFSLLLTLVVDLHLCKSVFLLLLFYLGQTLKESSQIVVPNVKDGPLFKRIVLIFLVGHLLFETNYSFFSQRPQWHRQQVVVVSYRDLVLLDFLFIFFARFLLLLVANYALLFVLVLDELLHDCL